MEKNIPLFLIMIYLYLMKQVELCLGYGGIPNETQSLTNLHNNTQLQLLGTGTSTIQTDTNNNKLYLSLNNYFYSRYIYRIIKNRIYCI